jgi:hypothetical protein
MQARVMERTMRRLISVVVWLAAFALAGLAFVRLAAGAAAAPPPLNNFQVTVDGTPVGRASVQCDPFYDAAFAEGDAMWYFPCRLDDQLAPLLVRFEPVAGTATGYTLSTETEVFGTLLGPRTLLSAAFARETTTERPGSQRLFFHANVSPTRPGPERLPWNGYFVLDTSSGQAVRLPAPAEGNPDLRGAAWVDGQVELIVAEARRQYGPVWRYTYTGEAWTRAAVPAPVGCANCLLQIAYFREGAWQLLWLDLPLRFAKQGEAYILPAAVGSSGVYRADATGARLALDLPPNVPERAVGEVYAFDGMFSPVPAGVLHRATLFDYGLAGPDMRYHYDPASDAWLPNRTPADLPREGWFTDHLDAYPQPVLDGRTPVPLYSVIEYNREQPVQERGVLVLEDGWFMSLFDQVPAAWQSALRLTLRAQGIETETVYALSSNTMLSPSYEVMLLPLSDGGCAAVDIRWLQYARLDAALRPIDAPNAVQHVAMRLETPVTWAAPQWGAAYALAALPVLVIGLLVYTVWRTRRWLLLFVPLAVLAMLVLTWNDLDRFITSL